MPRPKLTPQIAYNLAKALYDASGECDTRLEAVIAQNSGWAYRYAKDVLEGPFPKGEPMISQEPEWAYAYARDVLKGPWPEAEFAIAKYPGEAYRYAHYVLKAPFPEGESVIAQDADWAYWYAHDVLKGRPEDIARFKKIQRRIAQG
jgi:lambda repressor-like predicted transcriptional regulator